MVLVLHLQRCLRIPSVRIALGPISNTLAALVGSNTYWDNDILLQWSSGEKYEQHNIIIIAEDAPCRSENALTESHADSWETQSLRDYHVSATGRHRIGC